MKVNVLVPITTDWHIPAPKLYKLYHNFHKSFNGINLSGKKKEDEVKYNFVPYNWFNPIRPGGGAILPP